MKKTFFFLLVILSPGLFAQQLDHYKYIIIPESFEFTDGVDQYRLNSLSKFMFEEAGFETLMKNSSKPEDYQRDNCLGLELKPQNNSGLFNTKLLFQLINCENKVVYETKEGKSRSKDYEEAYQEALNMALAELKNLNYTYSEKEQTKIAATKAVEEKPVSAKIQKEVSKEELPQNVIVTAIPEVEEKVVQNEKTIAAAPKYENNAGDYFLKGLETGQGLYKQNTTEPVAILYPTEKSEVFIYSSLVKQGVAYKQNGQLIVEYFDRQTASVKKSSYSLQD